MQGLTQVYPPEPSSLKDSAQAEHRTHHAAGLLSARNKVGKDTSSMMCMEFGVAAQGAALSGIMAEQALAL